MNLSNTFLEYQFNNSPVQLHTTMSNIVVVGVVSTSEIAISDPFHILQFNPNDLPNFLLLQTTTENTIKLLDEFATSDTSANRLTISEQARRPESLAISFRQFALRTADKALGWALYAREVQTHAETIYTEVNSLTVVAETVKWMAERAEAEIKQIDEVQNNLQSVTNEIRRGLKALRNSVLNSEPKENSWILSLRKIPRNDLSLSALFFIGGMIVYVKGNIVIGYAIFLGTIAFLLSCTYEAPSERQCLEQVVNSQARLDLLSENVEEYLANLTDGFNQFRRLMATLHRNLTGMNSLRDAMGVGRTRIQMSSLVIIKERWDNVRTGWKEYAGVVTYLANRSHTIEVQDDQYTSEQRLYV
ncbi:hypothetical protein BC938DRAFT_472055 [Jimgerdemannia flammicorona]|uniref:Uncharacterized protein n=1 Tax=Jimgerdemannia flammicorona TaxID=994334 RepID=A0A433Q6U4_9FUNG|nr:hypothetical protein BC938DRAFT_472055 [Jimgerdemannia flammicorona]